MSNLSREKGVFEFLDLAALTESSGLSVKGVLAGPFQDATTQQQVMARLARLEDVEYAGPKYGADKDDFFKEIDVFVFPTLYRNEAEPIVIHEALSRGIPVIAFGRGCIPEVISAASGLVIDPRVSFAPAAGAKIKEWRDYPESYRPASRAARARFASISPIASSPGARCWRRY